MTSSSEPGSERPGPPPPRRRDGDATAELWRRRKDGTPSIPFAAALTGIDMPGLSDAVAISLAASEEARRLLAGMEMRIRTLTTGIETSNERCIFSVRGPVMWAETITARANALGNEDVFVCATASRSFDTVENQVLVAALDALARAERALGGEIGQRVPPTEAARVAEVAADARRWRQHPRLVGIRGGRLNGRDTARLRGGHRMARLAPVLAVRDRFAEPFAPDDLVGLTDRGTRSYHRLLLTTLDVLAGRGLSSGQLSLVEGSVRSGGLSFRHPATGWRADSGLLYRGVPLRPAAEDLAGASWATDVPERAVEISSGADVERLLDRLTARERSRRPATSGAQAPVPEPAQPSRSSRSST